MVKSTLGKKTKLSLPAQWHSVLPSDSIKDSYKWFYTEKQWRKNSERGSGSWSAHRHKNQRNSQMAWTTFPNPQSWSWPTVHQFSAYQGRTIQVGFILPLNIKDESSCRAEKFCGHFLHTRTLFAGAKERTLCPLCHFVPTDPGGTERRILQ